MKIYSLLSVICFSALISAKADSVKLMQEILNDNLDVIARDYSTTREGSIPGMEEMSEAVRFNIILDYLVASSGNPPFRHSLVGPLLDIFPESIRDDNELRMRLASEKNARTFHIMRVNMANHFSKHYGSTFIPEMAHMLLRSEPVSELLGEASRDPMFRDVSVGTYHSIIGYLKMQEASYEEPPDDLPHAKRKLILAQWLKENWPGCERIEIPSQINDGTPKQNRRNVENQESSTTGIARRNSEQEHNTTNKSEKNYVLRIALIIVAGSLVPIFFIWKRKTSNISP